jgi:hypothetical protein
VGYTDGWTPSTHGPHGSPERGSNPKPPPNCPYRQLTKTSKATLVPKAFWKGQSGVELRLSNWMKARRAEVCNGATREPSSARGVAGYVFESRMNITKTAFCFLSAGRRVHATRFLMIVRLSEIGGLASKGLSAFASRERFSHGAYHLVTCSTAQFTDLAPSPPTRDGIKMPCHDRSSSPAT